MSPPLWASGGEKRKSKVRLAKLESEVAQIFRSTSPAKGFRGPPRRLGEQVNRRGHAWTVYDRELRKGSHDLSAGP